MKAINYHLTILQEMERIFVTGPGGVGKSTYAKKLAEEKNLEIYQLDNLRYSKTEDLVTSTDQRIPEKDFRRIVTDTVSRDEWILEGTLKGTQDIIFPRCTKIIVLKASRVICTLRTIKRTFKRSLGIEENETFSEFKNLFSKDFIVFWVWRNYPRYVQQIEKALETVPHNAEVIEVEL